MKKILYCTLFIMAGLSTSCNDYLDSEPITSVSTSTYLYAENEI